ncbi:ATP-binding cassette domain-containing protein [Cognatiluteimonas telluris]|jgi:ABC-2 type transport system ATP-binding protein|uniref:ATP-binding cassette domain-containing protein n=1 Tax=Cognatiluteimonas telluris TaxID=1104775 RepID=UPI00140E3DAF|nr:ATP-binding cassette domain-containing protein [Lysobacter telluris]
MAQTVIELEGVHKAFGQRPVLEDLRLSVPARSIFAFLGNNGQGKSTTIRLIVGLLGADRGRVCVLGKDIRRQRRDILAQVGCIVDAPSAYPNLNANEFLAIGCALKRLPRSQIDRVLAIVGLHAERKLRIEHYSLGMKQRLALAHALLGQPQLLILDEPTNGLDPEGIQEVRRLLASLPEVVGCSIFFASHQLDEVQKTATHLALLENGRVRLQTSIHELTRSLAGALSLTVCDADKGSALLAQQGYRVQRQGPNTMLVDGIARGEASRVNASLVQAGLDLFESAYAAPSLEQWFLGTAATARSAR